MLKFLKDLGEVRFPHPSAKLATGRILFFRNFLGCELNIINRT